MEVELEKHPEQYKLFKQFIDVQNMGDTLTGFFERKHVADVNLFFADLREYGPLHPVSTCEGFKEWHANQHCNFSDCACYPHNCAGTVWRQVQRYSKFCHPHGCIYVAKSFSGRWDDGVPSR